MFSRPSFEEINREEECFCEAQTHKHLSAAEHLSEVLKMHYVYVLKSKKELNRYYIGATANLQKRISEHNAGRVRYSKRYMPWELETYVAFKKENLAQSFEKYLKSGSGYAFLKKRLLGPL